MPPTCFAVITLNGVSAVPDPFMFVFVLPTMPTHVNSGAATFGKMAMLTALETTPKAINTSFLLIPFPTSRAQTREYKDVFRCIVYQGQCPSTVTFTRVYPHS